VNYGRYIIREPRAGAHAKHIFQTQGFVDTYAPPEGIAALARSIGLPLVEPVLYPDPLFALTGVGTTMLPARNNVVLADGGTVTGTWMQFNGGDRSRRPISWCSTCPGRACGAADFMGSAGTDPMGVPTVPVTP